MIKFNYDLEFIILKLMTVLLYANELIMNNIC